MIIVFFIIRQLAYIPCYLTPFKARYSCDFVAKLIWLNNYKNKILISLSSFTCENDVLTQSLYSWAPQHPSWKYKTSVLAAFDPEKQKGKIAEEVKKTEMSSLKIWTKRIHLEKRGEGVRGGWYSFPTGLCTNFLWRHFCLLSSLLTLFWETF